MDEPKVPDRRMTLKWVLAVAGALSLPKSDQVLAFTGTPAASQPPRSSAAMGYGLDPKLLEDYSRGELWPLTLGDTERRTVAALCDLIIPADEISPSASSLGVVDFLDEWISAPYPEQVEDRRLILFGLGWIDAETQTRFGRPFENLLEREQRMICDPISFAGLAVPQLQEPARFFARYRDLTATGFYTTPIGRRDLGFVGNAPLARFDGPPPEVLRLVGLDGADK